MSTPNKEFKKIALFGKRDSTDYSSLKKIIDLLNSLGREVLLEKKVAQALHLPKGYDLCEMGKIADLVIIFGGDGTFLGVSRRLAFANIPFIGINAGRLGFITDIPCDSMEKGLKEILEGHYYTDSRRLLECKQYRNNELIHQGVALNEVVISRGISGGMIEASIKINQLTVSTQRADGLIISTPTGSTAYALSVGGPMIAPSVPCMLIIPVAPHSLSNRPVVIPESSVIEIKINEVRDAALYFDMQDYTDVKVGDTMEISTYKLPVKLLHPSSHNFFDTLSQKLHWNYMPSDR